jgi:glycosyltransferase involved in cell wall biosynthesis
MLSNAIAIDGSAISRSVRTGTETYASEIVAHLCTIAEPGELCVFLNEPPTDRGSQFTSQSVQHVPMPRLWTHGRLALELTKQTFKALFVPAHVIPVRHPRSVVTIHDVAFRKHPNAFGVRERAVLDVATRWNVKSAEVVIAVSRRTKADIVEEYGVDPERIVVIHHGVGKVFRPASAHLIEECRAQMRLDRRYLLSVGTRHPRKNHRALLEAFALVVSDLPDIDLVLAGPPGPADDAIHDGVKSLNLAGRVHMLGYVSSDVLPLLMAGAIALVLPSTYEGFGIPAIEAMACGTPVAIANSGGLPEVCGTAGLRFDPTNVESIAEAIHKASTDSQWREHASAVGLQWVERFRWDRAARSTLEVLRAVRDGRPVTDTRLGWADLVDRTAGHVQP